MQKFKWQTGRDSNPRKLALYTRSRRAPSTTRTPLCIWLFYWAANIGANRQNP